MQCVKTFLSLLNFINLIFLFYLFLPHLTLWKENEYTNAEIHFSTYDKFQLIDIKSIWNLLNKEQYLKGKWGRGKQHKLKGKHKEKIKRNVTFYRVGMFVFYENVKKKKIIFLSYPWKFRNFLANLEIDYTVIWHTYIYIYVCAPILVIC